MCRVSSAVKARGPVGTRPPLTSTIGGFPGEKKRSLIFAELRNIAASNPAVEKRAGAGAGATAAADAVCGGLLGDVDMRAL